MPVRIIPDPYNRASLYAARAERSAQESQPRGRNLHPQGTYASRPQGGYAARPQRSPVRHGGSVSMNANHVAALREAGFQEHEIYSVGIMEPASRQFAVHYANWLRQLNFHPENINSAARLSPPDCASPGRLHRRVMAL